MHAPSCVSAKLSYQSEAGEVDKEGGHLYECIEMLYKEDYHQELVQIHWMEDAISLVSSLLPSCLEHEFYPCPSPLVLAFTKVVSCLLLSEHKGPPSTKQRAFMSTGEEGSNHYGNPCKPTCHC